MGFSAVANPTPFLFPILPLFHTAPPKMPSPYPLNTLVPIHSLPMQPSAILPVSASAATGYVTGRLVQVFMPAPPVPAGIGNPAPAHQAVRIWL